MQVLRVTWLRTVLCCLFFFFTKTFWSLKHFSHLSQSCSKTCHNSVFSLYFQTFWPKWLNFFQLFQNVLVYYCKKQLVLMICLFDILYQHCFDECRQLPIGGSKGFVFWNFLFFSLVALGWSVVSIHQRLFSVQHLEKVQ